MVIILLSIQSYLIALYSSRTPHGESSVELGLISVAKQSGNKRKMMYYDVLYNVLLGLYRV
jgi:hypothetical protein